MIELFMKSKGQALARATLFARVWGADADVEEAILTITSAFSAGGWPRSTPR